MCNFTQDKRAVAFRVIKMEGPMKAVHMRTSYDMMKSYTYLRILCHQITPGIDFRPSLLRDTTSYFVRIHLGPPWPPSTRQINIFKTILFGVQEISISLFLFPSRNVWTFTFQHIFLLTFANQQTRHPEFITNTCVMWCQWGRGSRTISTPLVGRGWVWLQRG